MDDEYRVLAALGIDYRALESGCCGMAGSFGYERAKYGVSNALGERVLYPAVRRAPPESLVIADGFSCRSQIESGTDREGLHLAEVVDLTLRGGDLPDYPERVVAVPRRRAIERSMRRARVGILLSSAMVGGWLGWRALRKRR